MSVVSSPNGPSTRQRRPSTCTAVAGVSSSVAPGVRRRTRRRSRGRCGSRSRAAVSRNGRGAVQRSNRARVAGTMRLAALLGTAAIALALLAGPAQAHHTPVPTVVALVGSLQSELGCPGDWQPECAQTRLQPVAGSPGVFRGTFDVPAGPFEYKVALNGSWDENYGAGGAPGGSNIPLDAPGGPLTFTYDHATHVISDDAPVVLGSERAAHWLRRGLFAWDAPDAASYRLHVAPEGGLEVVDGTIPGDSYPLTPSGAPVPGDFPHLAALDTFELSAAGVRAARELLTGQLIVAAYDAGGELVDATGRADPRRARRPLRERRARAAGADLARPHAEARGLGADGQGRRARPRRAPARHAPRARRRLADRGPAVVADAAYAYAVTVYVPDEVVTNVVTDPYSLGLSLNSRRSLLVDLDEHKPTRLGPAAQAEARPARGLDDLRAARAGLLDHRRDRARPPPRHLPRLHRRPQRRHAPPAPPGRQRAQHAAPAALERHRDDRGGPLEAAGAALRPALLPARLGGSSRRASSRSATPTASTGATTRCTTRRPRAPTPRGPTAPPARSSSARWSRASTAPACAW